MFQLDHEVDAWCAAIGTRGPNAGTTAELKDHLYCTIDRLRSQGLSEQDAFHAATRELGDANALATEFAKNAARACVLAPGTPVVNLTERSGIMNAHKVAMIMIGQALAWAVVMMLVAYQLSGTEQAKQVSIYLFSGFYLSSLLPLVLLDYRQAMRAECAFFSRIFRSRKASGV